VLQQLCMRLSRPLFGPRFTPGEPEKRTALVRGMQTKAALMSVGPHRRPTPTLRTIMPN
jgi:hypothetical protein